MKILVTAGNTQTPIDRVRCITNSFTGRTGGRIALEATARGHRVTLLTSHPEVIVELTAGQPPVETLCVEQYTTFDQLAQRMAAEIGQGGYDGVVHCAAVSDYLADGVYALAEGTSFARDPLDRVGAWRQADGQAPALLDVMAGKVKSDAPELWIRLQRAPKLIDHIRSDWGFMGVLVKFKLEVGVDDATLLEIAERSRQHSHADLMAANTLEDAAHWAHLGPIMGKYERVSREQLALRLLEIVEQLHQERHHD